MTSEDFLDILKKGVPVWNEWRQANPKIMPEFSDTSFLGMHLSGVNFIGAQFSSCQMFDIDMSYAHFQGAEFFNTQLFNSCFDDSDLTHVRIVAGNLVGAKFRQARFDSAIFTGCEFSQADFSSANFNNANFNRTFLDKTNFQEAFLFNTVFANVDLSSALGLEHCNHFGPSIINNGTLENSGYLPEVFLKGIGFKNWEIEQAKLYNANLTEEKATDILYKVHELRFGSPIQVHNLFISYAHKDSEFVDKLYGALDAQGIRLWRDVKDLPDAAAGPLDEVLKMEMQGKTVLLVLSENSISSPWVNYELESAIDMGIKEGRTTLLPITLDNYFLEYDWTPRIKSKVLGNNIPNFSQWSDQSVFEKRLDQVVKGLDLFYKPS